MGDGHGDLRNMGAYHQPGDQNHHDLLPITPTPRHPPASKKRHLSNLNQPPVSNRAHTRSRSRSQHVRCSTAVYDSEGIGHRTPDSRPFACRDRRQQ